jgi:N-acetylglucosaminyl-diphospho-decaprenol L-rhamnosyltransferase
MDFQDKVSIIFVSFFSESLIENSIKQINEKIKIYIVENSRNYNLKKNLEEKYNNVKVIIPEKNNGNGAGINEGLKVANTKYVFYLDIDVKIENNVIENLYNYAERINNFSILAPKIKNFTYQKDFFISKNISKHTHSMRFITGCALFLKKEIIKDVGYFDENIFLYYEENDFYLRCLKKNKSIYLIDDCFIEHKGNSSIDQKFSKEIELNRNWHLMWSTFYFHKKHYGFITAYQKIITKLFSSFCKIIYFSIIQNEYKKKIYLARFSGILHAIKGNKSWYRPNLKIQEINNFKK